MQIPKWKHFKLKNTRNKKDLCDLDLDLELLTCVFKLAIVGIDFASNFNFHPIIPCSQQRSTTYTDPHKVYNAGNEHHTWGSASS